MNAPGHDADLRAYFSEAASWDGDRAMQARRATRTAWCTAGAATICALAASMALALLMPLKRVDPFVIRVDSSTGIVDVVPVYSGKAPMDEAVTRYFLTHYISTCERFNLSTAESDYQECGAFHGAQRNQAWYALWNPANPHSPLNLHKDGSVVAAQVQSVSFLRRASGLADMAQVRYLKAERAAPGMPAHVSQWVATIQYAYAAPSADPAIRRWNPLGFRLLEFVAEPEVAGEQTPGGDASPTPGAAADGATVETSKVAAP
jgi:type IV secretion system protein VirB8